MINSLIISKHIVLSNNDSQEKFININDIEDSIRDLKNPGIRIYEIKGYMGNQGINDEQWCPAFESELTSKELKEKYIEKGMQALLNEEEYENHINTCKHDLCGMFWTTWDIDGGFDYEFEGVTAEEIIEELNEFNKDYFITEINFEVVDLEQRSLH